MPTVFYLNKERFDGFFFQPGPRFARRSNVDLFDEPDLLFFCYLLKAREGIMSSQRFGKRVLTDLYPVVEPNLSDSGSVDCVLEFLVRVGGRSLPEVRTDFFFTARLLVLNNSFTFH